tara:strand:- start:61804 stop:62151 length:348 start_codon:yes stop_codon:yes gene_type:complete
MQTTGSWTLHEKTHDCARSQTESFCDDQADALDHTLIADLPNEQIRRMTRAELVRIVQAANPAFLTERCRNRLPYLDRVALERLAFLARFCCQNQITRPHHSGKTEHARINTQKR